MKISAIIKKAIIMQLRDYWALILTILSAPFFLVVYYMITSGGTSTYTLHYLNYDSGNPLYTTSPIIDKLKVVDYSNGALPLKIVEVKDSTNSMKLIKDRNIDILLVIPRGFGDSIKLNRTPHFEVFGEGSNPKYSLALILTITGIEDFIKQYSIIKPAYTFDENFMGNSLSKSEFDIYAPGIFIFSMIMLLLSASVAIIRDVEDRTMLRLKLSKITVFDYLLGNSFVQWMVGVVSFMATYGLAIYLGFHSQGSMILVLLICSLTILSIIGICLILISFCRNATMVLIVGNFPLFILMFFTGSMIPLPRNEIAWGLAWNDLLSPTHAVIAMNKIFTYGATFSELRYQIAMLLILTFVYYAIGVLLFKKRHLNFGINE